MGEAARKKEPAPEFGLVEVATGKAHALFDGYRVGRAAGDLILSDHAVSSKHCVFHIKGRSLEIEDLGSRNGTQVGGKQLEPHVRLALLPGVQVEIGNVLFEVKEGAIASMHIPTVKPAPPAQASPNTPSVQVEMASFVDQVKETLSTPTRTNSWSQAPNPGPRRRKTSATMSSQLLVTTESSFPFRLLVFGAILAFGIGWFYQNGYYATTVATIKAMVGQP